MATVVIERNEAKEEKMFLITRVEKYPRVVMSIKKRTKARVLEKESLL